MNTPLSVSSVLRAVDEVSDLPRACFPLKSVFMADSFNDTRRFLNLGLRIEVCGSSVARQTTWC